MQKLVRIFGLAFFLAVLTAQAEASLITAVSVNGAATACATDNNSVCNFGVQILDINPDLNVMSFGNLPIDLGGLVITGASQTATFGPPQNILNTSSTQIENTTNEAMIVRVAVSATDFTPESFQAFLSGAATWENSIGASILMRWFNDANNEQGAETAIDTPGIMLGQCVDSILLPADSTACSFGPITVSDLGLFSMTLFTEFVLPPGATVVNRGQTIIKPVEAVPEPALMALFAGGIGIGAWRLRRRQR